VYIYIYICVCVYSDTCAHSHKYNNAKNIPRDIDMEALISISFHICDQKRHPTEPQINIRIYYASVAKVKVKTNH